MITFAESGLPADPTIQRAFVYRRKEAATMATAHIADKLATSAAQLKHTLSVLHDKVETGVMTLAAYEQEKMHLELVQMMFKREQEKRALDAQMDVFRSKIIPAAYLVSQSAAASPVVVAAALLDDCVKTQEDLSAVRAAISPRVADVIEESGSTPLEMLDDASQAVKVMRLARLVVTVEATVSEMRDLAATGGDVPEMPAGSEDMMITHAKRIWDADPDLSGRFLVAVNDLLDMTRSPYKVWENFEGKIDTILRVMPAAGAAGKPAPAPRPPKRRGGGFDI